MVNTPRWKVFYTYQTWRDMKHRCYHNANYAHVHLCDRWNDFDNFLADMGERPYGCSIDRIDNKGDYSPSNCRWATPKQQARNRTTNKRHNYNGKQLLICEIADVNEHLLKHYYYDRHKTLEEAVACIKNGKKWRESHNG